MSRIPRNTPCPCGSGKKYKRCCELKEPAQQEVNAQGHYSDGDCQQARLLCQQGNFEMADILCAKLLRQNPRNAAALEILAVIAQKQGQHKRAIQYFTQYLQLEPNNAVAHCFLAKELCYVGKDGEALSHCDKALELDPALTHAYITRGDIQMGSDNLQGALENYRKALDMGTPDPTDFARAGNICVVLKDWEMAEQFAERAARLDSNDAAVRVLKSKLLQRQKDYESALEQVIKEPVGDRETKVGYFFQQGSVLDKLGRYEEAFSAYAEANRLKNAETGRSYNFIKDQEAVKNAKDCFSQDNWSRLRPFSQHLDETIPTPVFIVGFPRSGTSLLEQILGSHGQIIPAGELTFIRDMARDKCAQVIGSLKKYPWCLFDSKASLDHAALQALQDYYQSKVAALGLANDATLWVTDKMPHNLRFLGLISLLFPKSPIIHISRHPLDSCLSAYFSDFSREHTYCSSLENTARHYKLMMDLLEHFKQTIDMRFMEIKYSDLVNKQETTVRRLLEFIGAPWDERCLRHHESKRVVRTASHAQVTEKVYRSSLARYRDYWDAVQPIIPILDTTIKRFGYSLD